MAYSTLLVAEIPSTGTEIRIFSGMKEIGRMAGCHSPNDECTNFCDTIMDKYDAEAIEFCKEIMPKLSTQQMILLGNVMNAAIAEEAEIVEQGQRATEFFKLTIRLVG